MRTVLCATGLLALFLVASPSPAGQIEAYPIPASAEVSVGANSKGVKGPPVPGPGERSVVVVAPRNGVANAQILLKARGGAVTTRVTVSDLRRPGGAAIPAEAVRVRYGQYITGEKNLSVYRWQKDIGISANAAEDKAAAYGISRGLWHIDCLLPTPQCEVEEDLPRCAWLTFQVARDAAPGAYKGTAAVAGLDALIPIELEVVDAVVPDPARSAMTNDIRSMWEVIALGNGIPLEECWKSEKFWKVTAAYLEKLGQLRMSSCGIAVVAPSTTSSLGMVQWTRKGDRWSWDYAVLDRFIETYRKAVGEPRVLDATAFSQDEHKVGLSIIYTDADTGKPAFVQMGDDDETAALAVAFLKDLTAHLATLKLEKKLALGIWHDKMGHTGGKIRERLLAECPDLKLSLWAHNDGWGMSWKNHVGLYMSKCPTEKPVTNKVYVDQDVSYPIQMGMRRAFENPTAFGPIIWDCVVRRHAGMGQVDFSNWSAERRAKEYTYFGAGMFTSWQRQLVYPMVDDQVTTGVLYELFREYSQDFELIRLMQAKDVKTGFMADPRATLNTVSRIDRTGRCILNPGTDPAAVDRMHHDILHQAGAAKIRPEGQ